MEDKILDYERDWPRLMDKLEFLPENADRNAWLAGFILYLVNLA